MAGAHRSSEKDLYGYCDSRYKQPDECNLDAKCAWVPAEGRCVPYCAQYTQPFECDDDAQCTFDHQEGRCKLTGP